MRIMRRFYTTAQLTSQNCQPMLPPKRAMKNNTTAGCFPVVGAETRPHFNASNVEQETSLKRTQRVEKPEGGNITRALICA